MSIKCRICGNCSEIIFTGLLLNSNVIYYECSHCLYVQTENPYWLDQVYSNAIKDSDTGIFFRNYLSCKRSANLCWLLNIRRKPILDYAGGYGIFVRLMRDVGFNIDWEDPYCNNLFAKEFFAKNNKYELITAFEVFEHFSDPIIALDEIFERTDNLFFSTSLIPIPTPNLDNWHYYGLDHGQHIGFFRLKTLEYLAKKYNKYLYSYSDFHFFSSKKIPRVYYWLIMRFYNLFFFSVGKRSFK